MIRIPPITEVEADVDAKELLKMVKNVIGTVPNFIATMTNSPAVSRAYLGFSQALSSGALTPRLREQIALLVSEINGCKYCVAGHTVFGMGAGLTEEETRDARLGFSNNVKECKALEFARLIANNNGTVTDADVAKVRQAGYSDGEICEVVANVVLTILTNYFNLVAGTEVDFPAAADLVTGSTE